MSDDIGDARKVWQRAEVESPCVNVCVLHPGAKLCVGCLRTGDEIAAWSRLTPEARRAIMAELPARAPRLRDAAARPSRRRRERNPPPDPG